MCMYVYVYIFIIQRDQELYVGDGLNEEHVVQASSNAHIHTHTYIYMCLVRNAFCLGSRRILKDLCACSSLIPLVLF